MKALDYVAIDPLASEDAKVIAIAHALKKDPYAIAGRLARFLGGVARHAPDGNLTPFPDAVLDSWAGGLKGFGKHVRTLLCDATGQLTAWERFNGQALRRLQAERDRIAAYRQSQRDKKEREKNANSTGTVRVQNGDGTPLTDTDTHTASPSEKKESSSAAEPVVDGDLLRQHLPEDCHPELRIVLTRAREGAAGVALAIWRMLGVNPKQLPTGPGNKPAAPDEMAELIRRVSASTGIGWNQAFANSILVKIRIERSGGAASGAPPTTDKLDAWAKGDTHVAA